MEIHKFFLPPGLIIGKEISEFRGLVNVCIKQPSSEREAQFRLIFLHLASLSWSLSLYPALSLSSSRVRFQPLTLFASAS